METTLSPQPSTLNFRLALVLGVYVLFGALPAAHAATLTVTNLNDSGPGSLRQTIAEAASGDTIDFATNVTGTITLTSGQLVVDKDLTIRGPGATSLTVSGNHASRVLLVTNATASVSGLTVTRGFYPFGAGINIYNPGASLVLNACIVQSNAAPFDLAFGGGVQNNGTLIVINSQISGNHGDRGGGICNFGLLAATNSTFSGNDGFRGAAINNYGTANLVGCTFSGNNGTFFGNDDPDAGALVQLSGAGQCLIVNCTFASNIGGGLRVSSGTAAVASSIVAGTQGSPGFDVTGVISSLDFNLIRNTNGATITGVTTHNIYGKDPLLSPLADNGGPTPTHALLPGSPAIDHGSSGGLATDQRGLPRPFNFPAYFDADDASDIGAVEMQEAPQIGPVFTVNSTNDVDDGVVGIAHCSLREAIAAANAQPDTNTIDFAAEVPGIHSGVTGTITLTNGQLTVTNSVNINGPGAASLTISGNNASGVLQFLRADMARLCGLSIANGRSAWGGGVANELPLLTVSDCEIVNNLSTGDGGGVANRAGGTLVVQNSQIANNVAANVGGGITSPGSLIILNSTISGNHSDFSGGGVFAFGTISMTNATVSGNSTASRSGSGLLCDVGSISSISSSSVVSNAIGVGIVNLGAPVSVHNSIVAGNSAGDFSGTINSLDYNLIQNTNGVTITNLTAHNIYNQDPKLGPLADLGGQTPTHALRFDSPALDAGHSGGLTTDQRGLPRPIDDPNTPNAAGGDGSDIGAYEADPNLRLTAIEKVGADIRLRFNTLYGRSYAMESEDNLDNSWSTLSNNIAGDGSVKQAQDVGAANLPHRFYRGVLLLP